MASNDSSAPPTEKVYRFISDPEHKETLSGRVRAACLTCRRKKIKCSGTEPCQTCRERGLKCEGLPPKKRAKRNSPYPSTSRSPDYDCNDAGSVCTSHSRQSMDSPTSRQKPINVSISPADPSHALIPQPLSDLSTIDMEPQDFFQSLASGMRRFASAFDPDSSLYAHDYGERDVRQSVDWTAEAISSFGNGATNADDPRQHTKSISLPIQLQNRVNPFKESNLQHQSADSLRHNSVPFSQDSLQSTNTHATVDTNAPTTMDNLALLFPGCLTPRTNAFSGYFPPTSSISAESQRVRQVMIPFQHAEAQLTPNLQSWNASVQERDKRRASKTGSVIEESAKIETGSRDRKFSKDEYLFSKARQRPWPYN